jgi:hypothetical protein
MSSNAVSMFRFTRATDTQPRHQRSPRRALRRRATTDRAGAFAQSAGVVPATLAAVAARVRSATVHHA